MTVFVRFFFAECAGGEEYLGCSEKVFLSFNYHSPDQEGEPLQKLSLHPDKPVVWRNVDLDAAVLQLAPSHHQLPPPLGHHLGDASFSTTLYLIGHDDHTESDKYMYIDLLCPVKNASDSCVQQILQDPLHADLVDTMTDQRRTLLLSSFTHGSSGSPGFDQYGHLVVMYTRGYPGDNPQVNQAVNIMAIKEQMSADDCHLAEHLFG